MSFFSSKKLEKQQKEMIASPQAKDDPNTIESPYTQAWERAWKRFLEENPSKTSTDAEKRDAVVCGGEGHSFSEVEGVGVSLVRWREVFLFDGDQLQPHSSKEGSDECKLIALIAEEESELSRLPRRSWPNDDSFIDSLFSSDPSPKLPESVGIIC